MKATFTHDLISNNSKIIVKTCSESINYMGEIYGFIKDNGLNARMTTDFYRVTFTIISGVERGEHLSAKIPQIMEFIHTVQNGGYTRK
jgi:hypothetical protein